MDLKIKPEYLEYSIGGGDVNIIKLKNLPINKYEYYYHNGYDYMFNIINTNIDNNNYKINDIEEDDIN